MFFYYYFHRVMAGEDAESLWSEAGHQRQTEVCDGEGSWCLHAGHGHRQSLSCPAIRTPSF